MIPLYIHFRELKLRFTYCIFCFLTCFLTCYNYCFEIIYIFTKPFLCYKKNFIFTDVTEFFYTNIEVCFFICFYLIIPIILYHVWCFFIPSIFLRKRYHINLFILWCIFCIYSTFLYIYFFLLHMLFDFLINFQINNILLYIELQPRIQPYVNLSCKIFFMSTALWVLVFSFFFFVENSVYKIKNTCRNRSRNLFVLLVISSICAPPDIILQICFTLGLLVILEIFTLFSFLYCSYNCK